MRRFSVMIRTQTSLFFLSFAVRRVKAHHRGGDHSKGHPPRLRHVPAPAAESPAGVCLYRGLPGDAVPAAQVCRALRETALPLATRAQILKENPQLAEEVTDGRFFQPHRCVGSGVVPSAGCGEGVCDAPHHTGFCGCCLNTCPLLVPPVRWGLKALYPHGRSIRG